MGGRVTQAIPRWTDGLLVALFKVATSLVVLGAGFRALSDDDYARVVIAQGFAALPKLDPSGTSWLPLPFWIYGSAFALLGTELSVARAVALVLGVAAALLIWAAARVLGASRAGALLAAAIAAAFPYSAWLGAAALPEAVTAALTIFGCACTANSSAKLRVAGALALAAACLSRYEAWPAALVFAILTGVSARRERRRELAIPALLAPGPALLWLLHGAVVHGDALFFVQRIAAYKNALGGPQASWFVRLGWYPLALLRCEPELVALTIVALVSARALKKRLSLSAYGKIGLSLLGVLVFLELGSARGGVPTHHAERALLSLWFGCALFCGDVLTQTFSALEPRARLGLIVAAVLELTGATLLRPYVAKHEAFAARDAELEIGREARLLGADQLLVATDDYGYFAVIASFGQPARARVLNDHDPRRAHGVDTFSRRELIAASPQIRDARWLVAPRRHEPVLKDLGRIAARNQRFVLIEKKR